MRICDVRICLVLVGMLLGACFEHHRVDSRPDGGGRDASVDTGLDMGVDTVCPDDGDEDGVTDTFEGSFDTDGDGRPNDEDLDADDDGLLDGAEADRCMPRFCGILCGADTLIADSDRDGLLDGREVERGTDPCDLDSDDDGCFDPYDEGDSCEQLAVVATCEPDTPGIVVVETRAETGGVIARLIAEPADDVDVRVMARGGDPIAAGDAYVDVEAGDLLRFEVAVSSCSIIGRGPSPMAVVLEIEGTPFPLPDIAVFYSLKVCPD